MNKIVPSRLLIASILLIFVIFAGMVYYIAFENYSLVDAIYMVVITLTTVGYSEINPLSERGRVVTMIILLSGFGILTYVITYGITFMLEGELGNVLRRHKMEKLLQNIKNHYIICVKGETGIYIIEEFIKTEKPIVVITTDKNIIEKFSEINIPIINNDPAYDYVLEKANIKESIGVVIALGDDKDNLFVVLSARGLNQNVRIISQAIEKNTVVKLQKAGANEVVLTDAIGGMRIASATLRPTVVSFLDSMLKETEETLRIEEIQVTEKSDLVNKTIIESDISRRTGLLIVAIKNKRTGKYIHNPPGNYKFNSGDVLIVIGTPQQLKEQNSY